MAPKITYLNRDLETVDLIKRGDSKGLVRVYDDCRRMVVSHITRNNGTEEEANEVLQDAVVVLWERIRSGRFTLQSQIGTFVFATARNLWLRVLARKRREPAMDLDPNSVASDDPPPGEEDLREKQSQAMTKAFERLGQPCKDLLLLFYWEKKSMEEIAEQLGFANASTAKAKKYQCKEQLKRFIAEVGL